MKIKTIIGGVLLAAGCGLVLLGIYNLNNFLFVSNMTDPSTIPAYYAPAVILPMLVGMLLVIDGRAVRGMRSLTEAVLYGAGNICFAVATHVLWVGLGIPVLVAPEYQTVFIYFIIAFGLFIAGSIKNSISPRGHERTKQGRRKDVLDILASGQAEVDRTVQTILPSEQAGEQKTAEEILAPEQEEKTVEEILAPKEGTTVQGVPALRKEEGE